MGRRGPKPQPTLLKRLAGNPGQRRLNDQEPEPAPMAWDDTPAELQDAPDALAEWQRLVPLLRDARQITEVDRSALVAVCLEWARYLLAQRHVREDGLIVPTRTGFPAQNPYLGISARALSNCGRLWAELGLTPSSRSRVRMDTPGGADAGPVDPFAEFDDPPALRGH